MSKHQDLTGQKFGNGVVLQKVPKPEHIARGGCYWLVQCNCGKTSIVDTTSLKKKWQSCGCLHEPDLTGRRFQNGIVISLSHRYGGYRYWSLRCDCGKEYKAKTESLMSLNTKSCGCLNKRVGKDHHRFKGYGDISGDYWHKLERGARTRDIPFEIDIVFAWNLYLKQEQCCALTGWKIALSDSRKRNEQTASLDRIDSSLSYCVGNVQWVHKDVNRAKQHFDEHYFLEICKAVATKGGDY